MANKVTNGFTSLSIGAPASDGDMGTSLVPVGYIREDTIKFVQDKATKTEFYAEGVDLPVFVNRKAGPIKLNFTLMAPDADSLVTWLGGTVTGTTPKVYNAPIGSVSLIKSLKLIPATGFGFINIPKGQIDANVNAELSKNGLFQVEVEITVLNPDKAGVSPYMVSE